MESTAKLLEDSLLVIWNDRDAQRRLEKMKELYHHDIIFYESNEGPEIKGYEAINNVITKLQTQWTPEFMFELNQSPKVNHNIQHISWNLGIPAQTPAASGMDIAVVEDNKIKSLHLFLNTTNE